METLSNTLIIAIVVLITAIVIGAVLVLRSRSDSSSDSSAFTSESNAPLDMSKFDGLVEDLMRDSPGGAEPHGPEDAEGGPIGQQPPPPTDIMSGETERYTWSQTPQEVDVYVRLPEGTKKAQLSCNISANKLVVMLNKAPLVEGKLSADVRPDECNWQLGKNVVA